MSKNPIRSWEELATYAASLDPEKRQLAIECIRAQREAFPDQINEGDVAMVVNAASTWSRAERRAFAKRCGRVSV